MDILDNKCQQKMCKTLLEIIQIFFNILHFCITKKRLHLNRVFCKNLKYSQSLVIVFLWFTRWNTISFMNQPYSQLSWIHTLFMYNCMQQSFQKYPSFFFPFFFSRCSRELQLAQQEALGPQHVLFHSVTEGAFILSVFIRRDLIWYCSSKY